MDMSMAMPSSTMSTDTAMPSSTPVASSAGAMSMSMPMDMSTMSMTFYTSQETPLFSHAWTPNNLGNYAGTCIFLILLSFILRLLYAFKSRLETRWKHTALRRRYVITTAGQDQRGSRETNANAADDVEKQSDTEKHSPSAVKGILTVNGVIEEVKVIEAPIMHSRMTQPWRLSVDLPRAALMTIMLGVGYLLMLAVMTMNVGYFISVLAGAFVGELFLGRFSSSVAEDHH